ncbi:MAG TPA: MBL fold metallo-hydrolase [Novosphingobium sp.]|nr:MBL fold metallo-hydrolase [Novosphingobium sp.]
MSFRTNILMRGLSAALLLSASAPGVARAEAPKAQTATWVTLGTAGGPPAQTARAQIANALVVNGAVYLFDLGNGALRQMALAGLKDDQIKGVFLTHHHIDHNASLGPVLIMHWTFGRGVLPIIGPVGTEHLANGLADANAPTVLAAFPTHGDGPPPLKQTFKATDLAYALQEQRLVYQDENVKVSAIGVDHFQIPPSVPVPQMPDAVAYRIEAGGRTFVYSGDTGLSARLEKLASHADVLITEVVEPNAVRAFFERSQNRLPPATREVMEHGLTVDHLTPAEIGDIASKAAVGKVVLTHFVPIPEQSADPEGFTRDIKARFHGAVVAAHDLDRF